MSSREDFGFCLRKREVRGPLSREDFNDLFAQKRKYEKGLRFGRQPSQIKVQKREFFVFFASKLMEKTEKKGGISPFLMTQRFEKGQKMSIHIIG